MNIGEIKHPFLYSSVVVISVVVLGFVLVAIFGSKNINAYRDVAEVICMLWFLIGFCYMLVWLDRWIRA